MAIVWVAAAGLVALGLWALLGPRSMWWTTTAWKYNNPDAVEPSAAVYALTRLGGVVVIVGAGIVVWAGVTGAERSAAAAERCESEILPAWTEAWSAGEPPTDFFGPEQAWDEPSSDLLRFVTEFASDHDLGVDVHESGITLTDRGASVLTIDVQQYGHVVMEDVSCPPRGTASAG